MTEDDEGSDHGSIHGSIRESIASSLSEFHLPEGTELTRSTAKTYAIEDGVDSIDISNSEDMIEKRVNGYLSSFIQECRRQRLRDKRLWDELGNHFTGWKQEHFEKANKKALNDLRNTLRLNGVFVKIGRGYSSALALEQVVCEDQQHKWTAEEIEDQLEYGFNSKLRPRAQSQSLSPITMPPLPASVGVRKHNLLQNLQKTSRMEWRENAQTPSSPTPGAHNRSGLNTNKQLDAQLHLIDPTQQDQEPQMEGRTTPFYDRKKDGPPSAKHHPALDAITAQQRRAAAQRSPELSSEKTTVLKDIRGRDDDPLDMFGDDEERAAQHHVKEDGEEQFMQFKPSEQVPRKDQEQEQRPMVPPHQYDPQDPRHRQEPRGPQEQNLPQAQAFGMHNNNAQNHGSQNFIPNHGIPQYNMPYAGMQYPGMPQQNMTYGNPYQQQIPPQFAWAQPQEPRPHEPFPTSRLIPGLMKAYRDDMQYTGSDDHFDYKLAIFKDQCRIMGIQEEGYADAFPAMLAGAAREYYYSAMVGKGYGFATMILTMQNHFETDSRRELMLEKWNSISLTSIIQKNPDKSTYECFDILATELQRIQRGLAQEYQSDFTIRDRLKLACKNVEACDFARYMPSTTFEALCAQFRNAIAARNPEPKATFYGNHADGADGAFYVDRKYNRPGYQNNRQDFQRYPPRENQGGRYPNKSYSNKDERPPRFGRKCYVCRKQDCWSTKHTQQERDSAFQEFKSRMGNGNRRFTDRQARQYLSDMENTPEEHEDTMDFDHFLAENDTSEDKEEDIPEESGHFITSLGTIAGFETVAQLNDNSVRHALVKAPLDNSTSDAYPSNSHYSSTHFQGIMLDTGAANKSTAGQAQFKALQQVRKVILDTTRAGEARIRFGVGPAEVSIGAVDVHTPIGTITFHVVSVDTPFLICLADMDRLRITFYNLQNVVMQRGSTAKIPVVRKFGHPFMLLDGIHDHAVYTNPTLYETPGCYLTDTELRQLHRRFGHPSNDRLQRLLERSGHEFERQALEHLTKVCHECQKYGKSPGRFKFTLHEDREFNYCIYIDVMYIDGQPVLHVVDDATRFQAARWLKDMSAKHAWDALRACWIDVYIGPPDVITHDAGRNFIGMEFRQLAATMSITTHEVPVEAHHSIGTVERYHRPLRRAYECISSDLTKLNVDKSIMLQMAVKAVNDTAGPDGLVPTLLVFGAYPRMTNLDPPAPSISQRAAAIKVAMAEVRKCHATRDVQDALGMRNGPRTSHLKGLPLNAEVMVYREKNKWMGPYRLMSMDGETCLVDLGNGLPTKFRSTVVKPYYQPEEHSEPPDEEENSPPEEPQENPQQNAPPEPTKRGRGRPPGSKNKASGQLPVEWAQPKRGIALPYTHPLGQDFPDTAFLATKELLDRELSIKLRAEGVITTPGAPFEESRRQETKSLQDNGVFRFVPYDPETMGGIRLFNSRLVDEIKGKTTAKPYEKSRMVIQGYNDEGKEEILTQSPTIQRSSQRLLLAIAPSLSGECGLYLRDISQAYVQSTTKLNRTILARPPKEIANQLEPNTVMLIIKPLYGIAEAGTHWYKTYHDHHVDKLFMRNSTYDPCLMISTKKNLFAIIGMQTDDTLSLATEAFAALEDEELKKAKFPAKPHEILSSDNPIIFNGGVITLQENNINLTQKDQGKKIEIIDPKAPDYQKTYLEQRARGAYIATICQPEASFDLSAAAQHQAPGETEVKALNKRLQWQEDNLDRGLRFIPLDLQTAKLFIFVDASFANNKDLSSQIGYIHVLANETEENEAFIINGNVTHYSSTKCRRVTRSILASELYAMVQGADVAIAIISTINMITEQLNLPNIPTVLCTDSLSLYECLVKLGTTKEKRLMIDIMALRESYERRELTEVRWIHGEDNPADAMTKSNPTKALQHLIDDNCLSIRVKGWVDRAKGREVGQ